MGLAYKSYKPELKESFRLTIMAVKPTIGVGQSIQWKRNDHQQCYGFGYVVSGRKNNPAIA